MEEMIIYARRREQDGKSGYMPAYDVDWDEYNRHKAQGGLFKDFKGKKPQPFSKNIAIEHLKGRATIGIYALLPDNSSWFIAADFWPQSIAFIGCFLLPVKIKNPVKSRFCGALLLTAQAFCVENGITCVIPAGGSQQ